MTRFKPFATFFSALFLILVPFASDALAKDRKESQKDEFRELLSESDTLMMDREFDRAMEKSLAALDIAETSGNKLGKAEAMCSISKIDIACSRDEHAWEYASQAEAVARSAHSNELVARALVLKAQICLFAEISEDFNRNDEGLGYVDEAIRLSGENISSDRAMAFYVRSRILVNKNRWRDKNIDRSLYRQAEQALMSGDVVAAAAGDVALQKKAVAYWMRFYRQGGRIREARDFCLEHLESLEEADYLTAYQLCDHLTVLSLELDDSQAAAQYHQNCVYFMQKYITQKADKDLQEMETKYETALKQQTIRRRGYQLISAVLALALLVILSILLVVRNQRIARQKEELRRQNQSKEELLAFISKDFNNPFNAQENAIRKFVEDCAKLSPDEVKARCDEFICGAKALSDDVAQYVYNIIVSQRAAAKELELSEREVEIIRLSAKGMSAAQIAEQLFLSTRTVSNHKQNIYSKMDVKSNAEMISKAREAGIVKD